MSAVSCCLHPTHQYIAGTAVGAENWFWTDDYWLFDFATYFVNAQPAPSVISLSWGWWEHGQCNVDKTICNYLGGDSERYVHRVNAEFQKIGLRGITILSASGDSGAHGRTDSQCEKPELRPDFPGSSPYVVSVGGTQVVEQRVATQWSEPFCTAMECVEGGVEQAVSVAIAGFASGGGFSTIEPRPDWQQRVVTGYLASAVELPPASYFNASGRAYPDVAAVAHKLLLMKVRAARDAPRWRTRRAPPATHIVQLRPRPVPPRPCARFPLPPSAGPGSRGRGWHQCCSARVRGSHLAAQRGPGSAGQEYPWFRQPRPVYVHPHARLA